MKAIRNLVAWPRSWLSEAEVVQPGASIPSWGSLQSKGTKVSLHSIHVLWGLYVFVINGGRKCFLSLLWERNKQVVGLFLCLFVCFPKCRKLLL